MKTLCYAAVCIGSICTASVSQARTETIQDQDTAAIMERVQAAQFWKQAAQAAGAIKAQVDNAAAAALELPVHLQQLRRFTPFYGMYNAIAAPHWAIPPNIPIQNAAPFEPVPIEVLELAKENGQWSPFVPWFSY